MSLSSKLSINDVDVKGKRVLIRVSFPPVSLQSNGFRMQFSPFVIILIANR